MRSIGPVLTQAERAMLQAVRLALPEQSYPNRWEEHLKTLVSHGLVEIAVVGESQMPICTARGLSGAFRLAK